MAQQSVEDERRGAAESIRHASAPLASAGVMPAGPPAAATSGRRPSLALVALRRWVRAIGRTRLALVATYLVLLVATGLGTTFAIRQTLTVRLEHQTTAALRQRGDEMTAFAAGAASGNGERFETVAELLDEFLDRRTPALEEAFITFVGTAEHRSRLRSFPLPDLPPEITAQLAAYAAATDDTLEGSYDTAEGRASFHAVRVAVAGEEGVFMATILPAADIKEIRDLQRLGLAITFAVVGVAALCAWFFTGRVLSPVRSLTAAARSISEPDDRFQLSGTGAEAAEMATTVNAMLDRLNAAHLTQIEFLRAVGHELRAPLTVASGHLELLGDEQLDVAQRRVLALVLDELRRMGRLVDDLQSLAVAEQPDFIELRDVDVPVLVHELLGKASALGDRAWAIDAVDDGVVRADRQRLTEAVLNLVDNALHHTSPGDVVAIGGVADGDVWRLWVRDGGAGIPPDEHERVLERFVRGRASLRRYRGSGLGLAIVRTIAEGHGGRVELESALGVGTRVTLVLPQEGGHAPHPDR